MEINKTEIQIVERAVTDSKEAAVQELHALQLSYVGGGNAAVDFG